MNGKPRRRKTLKQFKRKILNSKRMKSGRTMMMMTQNATNVVEFITFRRCKMGKLVFCISFSIFERIRIVLMTA